MNIKTFIIVALIFMSMPGVLMAQGNSLYLVVPPKGSVEFDRAKNIAQSLKKLIAQERSFEIDIVDSNSMDMIGNDAVAVFIGIDSLNKRDDWVYANNAILSFIRSEQQRELFPDSNISFIYTDPDPLKQALLAKALYGIETSIAVIVSNKGGNDQAYRNALVKSGIKHKIIYSDNVSNAIDLAVEAKGYSSVVLVKDNGITRLSLHELIRSLYEKNGQGVIGFQASSVGKSETLGVTFSSLDNIADEIAKRAKHYFSKGVMPTSDYTSRFNVKLNKYVQRSLDIAFLSEKKAKDLVEEELKRGEQ